MSNIIQISPDDTWAVNFLIHLSDKNKHALGFLPRLAYLGAITRGRVSMLIENNEPAGYLINGPIKTETKVYQIIITDELRRIEHGKKLIDALRERCNKAKAKTISCYCADDLEANKFWRAIGFELTGQRLKDKKGKRYQNHYEIELVEKQMEEIRRRELLNHKDAHKLAAILAKGGIDLASFKLRKRNPK